MRLTTGLLLILGAVLAGCGSDVETAGDCNVMVRFDDTRYVGRSFTEHAGEPLGDAELAECHDVGDGAGQVFPDDPTWVEVRVLDGFDPREVVLVALANYASWQVMVAEGAPDDVLERVDTATARQNG